MSNDIQRLIDLVQRAPTWGNIDALIRLARGPEGDTYMAIRRPIESRASDGAGE